MGNNDFGEFTTGGYNTRVGAVQQLDNLSQASAGNPAVSGGEDWFSAGCGEGHMSGAASAQLHINTPEADIGRWNFYQGGFDTHW